MINYRSLPETIRTTTCICTRFVCDIFYKQLSHLLRYPLQTIVTSTCVHLCVYSLPLFLSSTTPATHTTSTTTTTMTGDQLPPCRRKRLNCSLTSRKHTQFLEILTEAKRAVSSPTKTPGRAMPRNLAGAVQCGARLLPNISWNCEGTSWKSVTVESKCWHLLNTFCYRLSRGDLGRYIRVHIAVDRGKRPK